MRIGIDARFAFYKDRRGIGTYSLNLIYELIINSVDSYFVLYVDSKANIPQAFLTKYKKRVTIRVIQFSFYPIWEQVLLPFYLRYDRVSIFHALGNTGPIFGLNSIKVVLTIHDVIFLNTNPNLLNTNSFHQYLGNIYRSFVVPIVARSAQQIITVSEFSKKDIYQSIKKLQKDKISVIYESYDPEFDQVLSRKSNRPISPSRYFLCLGAKDKRKRTALVIEAFTEVNLELAPDTYLIVVGLSELESKVLFSKLNVEITFIDRILFLPFVPIAKLRELYENAVAYIYASTYEGFGIPILESFRCGCPLIASNRTSIPEIAGSAAHFFDPYDRESLKDAIKTIDKDGIYRDDLVTKGYDRIKSFSWEKAALKTLEIYNKLTKD